MTITKYIHIYYTGEQDQERPVVAVLTFRKNNPSRWYWETHDSAEIRYILQGIQFTNPICFMPPSVLADIQKVITEVTTPFEVMTKEQWNELPFD